MKKIILLVIATVSSIGFGFSQEYFNTILSSQQLGINDDLQITYEYSGQQKIVKYGVPNSSDFKVVGGPYQSTSSMTSIINGKKTVENKIQFTFIIKANKKGTLNTPKFGIKLANNTVLYAPIKNVTVIDGSGVNQPIQSEPPRQNSRSDNQIKDQIFILATTNKRKAVIGEPIQLELKLYTRLRMQMNVTKLPKYEGFWVLDQKNNGEILPQRGEFNGIPYDVYTFKSIVLYPTRTGELTIEPVEVQGQVEVERRHPIDEFFNDPFFDRFNVDYAPITLVSKPITIEVSSLPNAPNEFSGGVGNFQTTNVIDKSIASVNDVITYTYSIQGKGNLNVINPPILPHSADYNWSEPEVETKINEIGEGVKIYKYHITPNNTGSITIPAIQQTFYNPEEKKYYTTTCPEVNISITESDQTIAKSNSAQNEQTIRPLIEKPTRSNVQGSLWIEKPAYWGAFVLSLMSIIIVTAYKIPKRKNLSENGNQLDPKFKIKKTLDLAAESIKQNDKDSFYKHIKNALKYSFDGDDVLSDSELKQRINSSKLDMECIRHSYYLIDQSNLALYTPISSTTMSQDFETLKTIIQHNNS